MALIKCPECGKEIVYPDKENRNLRDFADFISKLHSLCSKYPVYVITEVEQGTLDFDSSYRDFVVYCKHSRESHRLSIDIDKNDKITKITLRRGKELRPIGINHFARLVFHTYKSMGFETEGFPAFAEKYNLLSKEDYDSSAAIGDYEITSCRISVAGPNSYFCISACEVDSRIGKEQKKSVPSRKPIKFTEVDESEKRLLIRKQHESLERTNIDFNQLEAIEFEVTDSLYDVHHRLFIGYDFDNEIVVCTLEILEAIDAKECMFLIERSAWEEFLKTLLIEIDILNISSDEFRAYDTEEFIHDDLDYNLTIYFDGKHFAYNGGTSSKGVKIMRLLFEKYFTPPMDADYYYYKNPRIMDITIEELDLSTRAYKCLKRGYINTVEDLCYLEAKELMEIRGFGRTSLDEVRIKLASLGLKLRGE